MCCQQELKVRWARKLWRHPKAAPFRVERFPERGNRAAQCLDGPGIGRRCDVLRRRPEVVGEPIGRFEHQGTFVLPLRREEFEQPGEPGAPVAIDRGKVRARVEWPPVRRHEYRHRPAALPGERLYGRHVHRVDVWPFLAVHLDVDEPPVHQRGDCRVFERLVRHHVAPVARAVADREQHRPILCARPGKGLLTPRIPVHGVAGVLLEVRAGLGGEAVGHGRLRGAS